MGLTAFLFAVAMPLKHLLITGVLDAGYSRSRDFNEKRWWAWFLLWIAVEVCATVAIFIKTQALFFRQFLVVELTLLSASTFFERRALLGYELRTHLIWETIIVLFYLIFAVILFFQ